MTTEPEAMITFLKVGGVPTGSVRCLCMFLQVETYSFSFFF